MIIENEFVEENVRVIDSKRNYWFLRTYGGMTYSDFIRNDYIGFGLNQVPIKYIEAAESRKDVEAYKRLKEFIEIKENVVSQTATKYTNQLIQFHHQIKIGDVIIIPNKNSDYYQIGIIKSDVLLIENDNRTFEHDNKNIRFPEKRRNVEWIESVTKKELQNDLGGPLNIRSTISKINHVSEKIEGLISDVFIKENQMHVIINIDQNEDINAFEFNRFLNGLIFFYQELNIENGVETDEELFIKIKLQSPGKLLLKSVKYAAAFGLAYIVAMSSDSEFEGEIGPMKAKFKTTGFGRSLTEFLDANQRREMEMIKFKDSMAKLKVHTLDSEIGNNVEEEGEEN